MLKDNFYTITQQTTKEDNISTKVSLDTQHPIYEGHFPQQAVVPGVCMMQMIAELTSEALGQTLKIKKGRQIKFLIPIVPHDYPNLDIQIQYSKGDDDSIKVKSSIHADDKTFFKFRGVLV